MCTFHYRVLAIKQVSSAIQDEDTDSLTCKQHAMLAGTDQCVQNTATTVWLY